ncbi:MAG TPA: hypothetical protein VFH48_12815 [Chloroflexota bacterium]|nr:hypothetical protein [Chloroflexota bacterium]
MTLFDSRTFLAIAEELGQRGDQAARRTALGRAYYATLGVAYRALPPADQARIGPGQIHDLTWMLYAASTAQPSRRIGGIGYRLRTARRQADYRSDRSFSERDVDLILRQARQALQLLDRHGYRP